jgi:tetrahydromethanopterin S-methyltransferase subunit B
MDSWDSFKNDAMTEKATLDAQYSSQNVKNKITQMNQALESYTSRAGISPSPDSNPEYTRAQDLFKEVTSGLNEYATLNKKVSDKVKAITSDENVAAKLQQVGQLRNSIATLEKELKDAKQDLDVSATRQHNVQHPRQEVSFYQGISSNLGFTRPIKTTSVAFLLGFGLFILFLTGLLLKDFFMPSAGEVVNIPAYTDGGIMTFFTDTRFYGVVAGAILVFTLSIILAVSGKLGKTVKT